MVEYLWRMRWSISSNVVLTGFIAGLWCLGPLSSIWRLRALTSASTTRLEKLAVLAIGAISAGFVLAASLLALYMSFQLRNVRSIGMFLGLFIPLVGAVIGLFSLDSKKTNIETRCTLAMTPALSAQAGFWTLQLLGTRSVQFGWYFLAFSGSALLVELVLAVRRSRTSS